MFYKDIAHIYAQSRPPYPQQILDLIMRSLPLANRDLYIDLGCGTGELLLPLSVWFKQSVGIDPDTSMLSEAAQKIDSKKIANVQLIKSIAENYLINLDKNTKISLVTSGRSFHWMDQEIVAREVYSRLIPGGIFATLGEARGGIWKRESVWARAVHKIIFEEFPHKEKFVPIRGRDTSMEIIKKNLHSMPFNRISDHIIDVNQIWDIEMIVNLFYSAAGFLEWLNKDTQQFECKVREALLNIEPIGRFEDISGFGITLCVK